LLDRAKLEHVRERVAALLQAMRHHRQLTAGRGADAVLELVGSGSVVQEGIAMLAPGGTFVEMGNIVRGRRFPPWRAQAVAEAIADEADCIAELLSKALATSAAGRARVRGTHIARQAGLYVLGLEAAITYVFVSPGVEVSPGYPSHLAVQAWDELRHLRPRV
jgi:hypothetical protein